MQLTAKLIQILPMQSGNGKNGEWRKQEIIVETDGQYPKKVCISMWGDKINEPILQIGNILDINFDVESREYNGRWYTDVKAWKVDLAGQGGSTGSPSFEQADPATLTPPVDLSGDSGDDLPF